MSQSLGDQATTAPRWEICFIGIMGHVWLVGLKKRGGVLGAMGAKRDLVKNVKGKRRSLGGTFKARKHILKRSVRINRLKGKNSQVL